MAIYLIFPLLAPRLTVISYAIKNHSNYMLKSGNWSAVEGIELLTLNISG